MSNVGTIAVGRILPDFQPTGDRNYIGRHRIRTTPVAVRASTWVTNAAHTVMDTFEDASAGLTSNALRRDLSSIARAWHTIDRAAYGRIPKTWRHRLETRAAARRLLDERQADTEAWWAGRQADYAPAFGIHEPTQPLHVIKEKTNA